MKLKDNPLKNALRAMRKAFWSIGVFSFVINLLMLTGPLFMLQLYDRVLASRSVPTLIVLLALVISLYAFLGLFDFLRARLLSRIGYYLETRLMEVSFRAWIFQGLSGQNLVGRPLSDLSSLRMFMGSPAIPALFDLPWTPIYLTIVFMLHFKLGLFALTGAFIIFTLAIANQMITRNALGEASIMEMQDANFSEKSHRNADTIIALGMTGNLIHHWKDLRYRAMSRAQAGGNYAEGFASTSKVIRMMVQSGILGLGGYLAILQEISAGSIVAASIIAGRALAPVDQTIGNWRNISKARQSYQRLSNHLSTSIEKTEAPVTLPRPQGRLSLKGVTKLAKGISAASASDSKPILYNINLELQAGDALGVIGPSAAGKTSLARLLVGLWLPDQGKVRLDGATYDQWDSDLLGQYIGYLPQSVELLNGTVKQNIARFDPTATDEEVIAAAQIGGVHDLILQLSEGYSTQIGLGAQKPLSGGQSQRIALARALFRTPTLIVLDEPSSNLDAQGDDALTHAINQMRQAGSIVIVMTHRPSAIAAVNKVLMINDGQQSDFGDKVDILNKITRPAKPVDTKGI